MNRKAKKTLKISAFALTGVLVLLLLGILLVLNFVFTPAKITPVVRELAENAIEGEVKIGKVELTFFSTFPKFGLKAAEGCVDPRRGSRPLISFAEATLIFNPIAFLRENKLQIDRITFTDPDIYLYTDSTGRSNLDIFRTDVSADTVATDTLSGMTGLEIDVNRFRIRGGRITLDDRSTRLYCDADSIDMRLRGNVSARKGNVGLNLSIGRLLLWQKDELLCKNVSLGIVSDAGFDRDSTLLRLGKTTVDVNGIRFGAQGTLRRDTLRKTADVRLGFGLHMSSLADVLNLIPDNLIRKDGRLKTQGEVFFQATAIGRYGAGEIPELRAELKIDGASARYDGMKSGIRELTTEAETFVDLTKRRPSYLRIKKFVFRGDGGNGFTLTADAERLLDAPRVKFKVSGDVNLDSLARIFPLQEGVEIGGRNNTSFEGEFALNDLKRRNYGQISLNGNSSFKDLRILVDGSRFPQGDSTYLYVMMKSGSFDFSNSLARKNRVVVSGHGELNGSLTFNGLGFRDKKGRELFLNDIAMEVSSKAAKDTAEVSETTGRLVLGGIRFDLQDTMRSRLSQSELELKIVPDKQNRRQARITATLRTDSLDFDATVTGTKASLTAAVIRGNLLPPESKGGRWRISGGLGFRNLHIFSELFPIPVSLPSTQLTFRRGTLNLRNARLKIGRSDVTATGHIDSLFKTLLGSRTVLKGELNIASQMMDINAILDAISHSSANRPDTIPTLASLPADTLPTTDSARWLSALLDPAPALAARFAPEEGPEETGAVPADSSAIPSGTAVSETTEAVGSPAPDTAALGVFVIPPGVDFKLNVNIDRARLSNLLLENIRGRIDVSNGELKLVDLDLDALGANMCTSALYRTQGPKKADIGINLAIARIDVSRLGEIMPSLDTLLPMLKSFGGTVDVALTAQTEVDSALQVDLKSLSSILHLSGRKLSVADDETFRSIAKMLMFKDKQKAIIDTLSANVVVRNGNVTVLPFEAAVDRYRVIIGGTQDFDMNFNYNISVMKSPLPFKAGVDIFGNLDDFDFKVTKAKLKKSDFGLQQVNVDSARRVMIRKAGLQEPAGQEDAS